MALNAASDIIATTNEHWIPSRIPDLIGDTSPLLAIMLTRGDTLADGKPSPRPRGEFIEGGNKVKRTLRFARGASGGTYSGYDTLNTAPTRTLTHVSFEWRKYYEPIPFSFDEELESRGMEAIHNLFQAKVDGAMADQMDKIATGLYLSAALRGIAEDPQEKGLNGLRELCDQDRTWGNIDSTNYVWWDSGFLNETGYTVLQLTDPTSEFYIIKLIRNMMDACLRGGKGLTHIFTTSVIFNLLEDVVMHDKIYMNTGTSKVNTADIGYEFINFRGVKIIPDPGYCPDYHMFGLNLNKFAGQPITGVKARKDAFFTLSNTREIANQLSTVKFLITHLLLYCDQPDLVGMFTDLAQT